MSRSQLHKATESEQAFIGSLLRLVIEGDYDLANDAAFAIEPEDFHEDHLRPIFGAFRRLLKRGEPFDQHLVLAECNGSVENVAGVLLEAGASVETSTHIDGHAKVIRKAASHRRAVCLVQDTLNELNKTTDPAAAIRKLRTKLDEVASGDTKAAPIVAEPYRQYPLFTFPAAICNYVGAVSAAIGCDESFIALPMLGCLARAIGNKRVIRLKSTWTEPAIIWAAIVGKSGTHKTPALQAATSFLNREQAKAIAAYQDALARHEQDVALYERDHQAWKRSKSTEPPPYPPQEPVCNRFITSDCTIEALAKLLHDQYDGVQVVRDELAGWLGGIAEYKNGKGSDLGHWLASWSAAPMTVDRKTGAIKMIHVPRASVSIIGGIQPGVLRKAIGQEHMQDGLCARLLLAMPETKPVQWTDAIVSKDIEHAASEVFDRLIGMTIGADADGNLEPFAMPLTSGAKSLWVEYYNRHRAELVGLDDDLAAAWSKLEAYAARFALIFQLCSWASGDGEECMIEEASIEAGIALSDWFGNEARRVYGLFSESADDQGQRELIDLIRRRGGSITARDLQASSRQYRASGEAEAALNNLVTKGHGKWKVIQTSRRPRTDFVLSSVPTLSAPTVLEKTAETDNTAALEEFNAALQEAVTEQFAAPF